MPVTAGNLTSIDHNARLFQPNKGYKRQSTTKLRDHRSPLCIPWKLLLETEQKPVSVFLPYLFVFPFFSLSFL